MMAELLGNLGSASSPLTADGRVMAGFAPTEGVRMGPGIQDHKVFVGGISWETTEATIRSHFGCFGEIRDCALMTNKWSGAPRGFAFVSFVDERAVERVLRDSHKLDGRVVEVKRAIPRDEGRDRVAPSATRLDRRKLFIGGLASTVAEVDLRMYFGNFGPVLDATVMIDRETNRSRGFGFVTFATLEATDAVLRTAHRIHDKGVEIKPAQPRTERSFEAPSPAPYPMSMPQGPGSGHMRGGYDTRGGVYGFSGMDTYMPGPPMAPPGHYGYSEPSYYPMAMEMPHMYRDYGDYAPPHTHMPSPGSGSGSSHYDTSPEFHPQRRDKHTGLRGGGGRGVPYMPRDEYRGGGGSGHGYASGYPLPHQHSYGGHPSGPHSSSPPERLPYAVGPPPPYPGAPPPHASAHGDGSHGHGHAPFRRGGSGVPAGRPGHGPGGGGSGPGSGERVHGGMPGGGVALQQQAQQYLHSYRGGGGGMPGSMEELLERPFASLALSPGTTTLPSPSGEVARGLEGGNGSDALLTGQLTHAAEGGGPDHTLGSGGMGGIGGGGLYGDYYPRHIPPQYPPHHHSPFSS